MPAHTATASFTDTIYAISATLPVAYDAAGYAATTITYTAIGKTITFLPYGAKRSVGETRPVSGAVEFTKGSPNYGAGDMTMSDVPADAGQVILKAAEASPNHYSLKITYPDGEIHFMDVINSGWVLSPSAEGSAMIRTATLNINKVPVVVAAE